MAEFRYAYNAIDEANLAVQDYAGDMLWSGKPPAEPVENKIRELQEKMSDVREVAHELNEMLGWD